MSCMALGKCWVNEAIPTQCYSYANIWPGNGDEGSSSQNALWATEFVFCSLC